MHGITTMMATALAGGILCSAARASVGPQLPLNSSDNLIAPSLPASLADASLSAPEFQLEVGGEWSERVMHAPAKRKDLVAPALQLAVKPTTTSRVYADVLVGQTGLLQGEQGGHTYWRGPASSKTATEWAFIRREVVGPSGLDALGDLFDVEDDERPWSTTTSVHVLAPTGDWIVPFATIAYEEDSVETYDRFGLGGGAQLNLDKAKHTTFGAELIYFGDHVNDSMSRETRLMARLQIEF